MVLTAMNFGGMWDVLSQLFKIKTQTLETLVMGFYRVIAAPMYDAEVKERSAVEVRDVGKNFSYFPLEMYATGVTFQNSNRPSENHDEEKVSFSGKPD